MIKALQGYTYGKESKVDRKRNNSEEELKTFGGQRVCELMSTKHKFAFNLILISLEYYVVVLEAFVYINY